MHWKIKTWAICKVLKKKADRWLGLGKGGGRSANFCRETSEFKGRGTVRFELNSTRVAELTREKRGRERNGGGHGFFLCLC